MTNNFTTCYHANFPHNKGSFIFTLSIFIVHILESYIKKYTPEQKFPVA